MIPARAKLLNLARYCGNSERFLCLAAARNVGKTTTFDWQKHVAATSAPTAQSPSAVRRLSTRAEDGDQVKVELRNQGEVLSTLDDRGVFRLVFNRPTKYNACDVSLFSAATEQLEQAAKDDRVHLTVISGAGPYFSSGLDLIKLASPNGHASLQENLPMALSVIRRFCLALVEHPKVIVGVINGPGIGIGLTMLAHFDFVYAARSAWFIAPFLNLGLMPEAASSYSFLRAIGPTRAKRLLILGERITAEQLQDVGLISECVDDSNLHALSEKRIAELADLPKYSLKAAKQLLSSSDLDAMRRTVVVELEAILEGFKRPEVAARMMKAYDDMMSKKKKK